MTETPLIVLTIQKYHPQWEPPDDTGREWLSVKCPFHGDDSPSASVSFQHNAFRCFACPAKGDVIALIKQQEEVDYSEALRISEAISPRSGGTIQAKPARKPSRKVLGDTRSGSSKPSRGSVRDKQIRPGIRL